MAAAAPLPRGRSYRLSGRLRRRKIEQDDDMLTLDLSRKLSDNVKELLTNVVKRKTVKDAVKLASLNNFVKLVGSCAKQCQLAANWGYSPEDVVLCLRTGLMQNCADVRAACMRALRHYVGADRTCITALLGSRVDFLAIRCLDLGVDGGAERTQALRLVRHLITVAAQVLPTSLVRCLVAIARDGVAIKDHLTRGCLETLCELALQNAEVLAQCSGVYTLLRAALDYHDLDMINEVLVQTVLYLLNKPRTRKLVRENVELELLLSPFTDCLFKYSTDAVEGSSSNSADDDLDARCTASRRAVLTILRSWPGLVRFCMPGGSGLRSFVGALQLSACNVQKHILECLFELFHLQLPAWSADFNEALFSADPYQMKPSWRLSEGFVADEGAFLLPHASRTRANLIENHAALLTASFIGAGLLEALVDVIVKSRPHASVRATILLGELLHLSYLLLPPDCSQHNHSLPTLVSIATSPDLTQERRQQASLAVTCLDRLHSVKKRGPVPASLHLDHVLQTSQAASQDNARGGSRAYRGGSTSRDKHLSSFMSKDTEEGLRQAITNSQIFLNFREYRIWDWELISAIFKWSDESLKNVEDQLNNRFLRRLLQFFKPSTKFYSMVELTDSRARLYTIVGCQLLEFLLTVEHDECRHMLMELLNDVASCLAEIRQQNPPPDAQFGLSNVFGKCCQDYFLFVGKLSRSPKGMDLLEKSGVLQYLLDLVTITSHDAYVKLIVSALDYSSSAMCRVILTKALTATSESARLYTANFMRVLLRARMPFFSSWSMELLVTQLYDQSRTVAMKALSVIDEACEDKANLLSLIELRPSFLHLGDRGAMLLARFLSVPEGFRYLRAANYLEAELERWRMTFNYKYVTVVEELLNEALTSYEKTFDDAPARRSTFRRACRDVFVPIHVYGQLVQHRDGYELLESLDYIASYFECVRSQPMRDEADAILVKAALWAVGHIGASVWGMRLLERENVIPDIIKLAEECGVFSVRGTAFYVLGLIASTKQGVSILHAFGWESVTRNHAEMWPVHLPAEDEPRDEDVFAADSFSVRNSFGGSGSTTSTRSDSPAVGTLIDADRAINDDGNQSRFLDEGIRSRSGTDEERLPNSRFLSEFMSLAVDEKLSRSLSRSSLKRLATSQIHLPSLTSPDTGAGLRVMKHHQRSSSDTSQAVVCKSSGFGDKSSEVPNDTTEKQRSSSDTKAVVSSHVRASPQGHVSFELGSCITSGVGSSSDSLCRCGCMAGGSVPHGNDFETSANAGGMVPGFRKDSNTSLVMPHELSLKRAGSFNQRALQPYLSTRKEAKLLHTPSSLSVHDHDGVGGGHVVVVRYPSSTSSGRRAPAGSSSARPSYTTTRDAVGLATLRTLRKGRTRLSTQSADDVDESGGTASESDKSDSRHGSDLASPTGSLPRSIRLVASTATSNSLSGRGASSEAHYIGLCLPLDVSLLLQVHEGEDSRSSARLNNASSLSEDALVKPDCRFRTGSSVSDDGLECHTMADCIVSHERFNEITDPPTSPSPMGDRGRIGQGPLSCIDLYDSASDSTPATASQFLPHSLSGRRLLRKECTRLVMTIASSIGVSAAEEGLLRLKEQFSYIFQDICLYSEVCHLLASYNFRSNARRFIQDLFYDLNYSCCFEEAESILGLSIGTDESCPVTSLPPSRPQSGIATATPEEESMDVFV